MTQTLSSVVIIPARFKSSRFPGKPLALINGQSLICRVWNRCVLALGPANVYIATDDLSIKSHCESFGAQVLMTSENCLTGTDRIAEASKLVAADCYINVQGDEPMVSPEDILAVLDAFIKRPELVHCAMCPIESEGEFKSLSVPKVVARRDGRLMYISRATIPSNKEGQFESGMKQVCIYAFAPQHLSLFGAGKHKTKLEEIEDIEILRFLESGVDVNMVPIAGGSIAVDFPDDVGRVEESLRRIKLK